MPCPIVRPAKHKSTASLGRAVRHHLRDQPTHNADPARAALNQVLLGPPAPGAITKAVSKRTDELVKRKDAVRSVELFLGASNDFWDQGGDWKQLSEAYKTWMKDTFGEANVVGFGVHLDERQPHFWAVITPITPDGRLSASHWFDGPAKLRKMNDTIAAATAHLGMERGRPHVKATHLDMKVLQQAQAGNMRAKKAVERELAKREAADLARAAKAEKRRKEAEERLPDLERRERDVAARETWAAKAFAAIKEAVRSMPQLDARRVMAALKDYSEGYTTSEPQKRSGLPLRTP